MPVLLPLSPIEISASDQRRHPAIYREEPSSAVAYPMRQTERAFLDALRQVAETAVYVQVEQAYNARFDELLRFRALEVVWDSHGATPPQDAAINAAERSLAALKQVQAIPVAIRPSNEGGVGVCFTS